MSNGMTLGKAHVETIREVLPGWKTVHTCYSLSDSLSPVITKWVHDEECISLGYALAEVGAARGLALAGVDPGGKYIVENSPAFFSMIGSALLYILPILQNKPVDVEWHPYLHEKCKAAGLIP